MPELPTASAATLRQRRTAAVVLGGSALAAAGLVAVLTPDYRGLAWYGLYAIPAHLLVSFLANEPMLFAAARDYHPGLVALAGTAGCIVAIVLDYALIGWFMRRHGRFGWAATLCVSIAVPIAFFLVFERWFLVPLPKGPLEHWLGL